MPLFAELAFLFMLIKYVLIDKSAADYSFYSVRVVGIVAVYALVYAAIIAMNHIRKQDIQNGAAEFERKRYDDIVQSSMQMKKLRHYMKNPLLPVKMELDEGNYDSAKARLDDIIDNVGSIGELFNTGNRTVDYILNSKLSGIKNRRIILTGNVESIDLSVMLGNILDNALEATNGIDNSVIELSFFENKSMCNIVCKNSVKKSVLANNPQLESSKKDKTIHGFGVMSIKRTAEKYHGSVAFFEENEMFGLHLMFPIK